MRAFLRKINKNWFYRLFYQGDPPWDTGVSPPELLEFLEHHPAGRALDLGCGTGTNVLTMADHGWQAEGVDFVPKAIRNARRKIRPAGEEVKFTIGKVTDPDMYSGQYDLILDIGCFHSLTPGQRQRVAGLVADHLAPGGTYMLYGFLSRDGSQIAGKDLDRFTERFDLIRRENSGDPTGPSSAWFWFQHKDEKR